MFGDLLPVLPCSRAPCMTVFESKVDADGDVDLLVPYGGTSSLVWHENMLCTPGRFGPAGNEPCTPCPAGTFGTAVGLGLEATAACSGFCPAGQFSEAGAAACSPCVGTWLCFPCVTAAPQHRRPQQSPPCLCAPSTVTHAPISRRALRRNLRAWYPCVQRGLCGNPGQGVRPGLHVANWRRGVLTGTVHHTGWHCLLRVPHWAVEQPARTG
jgi:hypothetical protein